MRPFLYLGWGGAIPQGAVMFILLLAASGQQVSLPALVTVGMGLVCVAIGTMSGWALLRSRRTR